MARSHRSEAPRYPGARVNASTAPPSIPPPSTAPPSPAPAPSRSLFAAPTPAPARLAALPTLSRPPDRARQQRVTATYARLPLSFEANQGQVAQPVQFLSRGSGYSLFLTPTETVLTLSPMRNAE